MTSAVVAVLTHRRSPLQLVGLRAAYNLFTLVDSAVDNGGVPDPSASMACPELADFEFVLAGIRDSSAPPASRDFLHDVILDPMRSAFALSRVEREKWPMVILDPTDPSSTGQPPKAL